MSLTNGLHVLLPVNFLRGSSHILSRAVLSACFSIGLSCCDSDPSGTLDELSFRPAASLMGEQRQAHKTNTSKKQPSPVFGTESTSVSAVSQAPHVVVDNKPRLYPLTRNVWVYPEPNARRSWIGFLWFGSSVVLRDVTPKAGPQCSGRWYAIEPRGFVCVDDKRATLDPKHKSLAGITRFSPRLTSPWPHQYGESLDLRRYRTLPSEREQRRSEWYYQAHQTRVARLRDGHAVPSLMGVSLERPANTLLPLPPVPRTLRMGRSRLKRRSTVAWSEEVNHNGRPFLLSADLLWVPKDRVSVYPQVNFEGVHLPGQRSINVAFFRDHDRPQYKRTESGRLVENGKLFPRLSRILLNESQVQQGDNTFHETTTPGLFVKQRDAVIPQLRTHTPWGTPLGKFPDPKAPTRGRQTWMEASILGGWLVAYEGHRPVFATLISPGRGGAPVKGRRPVETASTPTGRFKITGKFATATMVSSSELVHSSVPWAQNFSGPHALHSAYWHNRWGELKSGGCINLSPIDGQWLFQHFTEPRLPRGWHGVRWLPKKESATTLLIKRR